MKVFSTYTKKANAAKYQYKTTCDANEQSKRTFTAPAGSPTI